MLLKICTQCGKEKDILEFYKTKSGKYGVDSTCKICRRTNAKSYSVNYRKNHPNAHKNWENKNPDYRSKHIESINFSQHLYTNENPWMQTLDRIKSRCNNSNVPNFKWYGGRGIKCLITSEELKELWFRDKAYLMEQPSIDRINNDGNYTFENCQYLELVDNLKKKSIDRNKYA